MTTQNMNEETRRAEERNKRLSKLSLIAGAVCVGAGIFAGAAHALYERNPVYLTYDAMIGAGASLIPAMVCTFANLRLIGSYSRRLDERERRINNESLF